jgi:hypothetical protein
LGDVALTDSVAKKPQGTNRFNSGPEKIFCFNSTSQPHRIDRLKVMPLPHPARRRMAIAAPATRCFRASITRAITATS